MAGIDEMARDLGLALGRTPQYQDLRSAARRADDDRELVSLRNELSKLEETVARSVRAGEEPPAEVAEEYEQVFGRLQASPVYQGLVAAQANFDRVLGRVNEGISKAIEEGAKSSIIITS